MCKLAVAPLCFSLPCGWVYIMYMYVLQRNMQCKSQVQLMKYMIDVAMGMHYLAEKGIIHRVSHNEGILCCHIQFVFGIKGSGSPQYTGRRERNMQDS